MLRIRDVYPGSRVLPIPDPGSKNSNKREGWKKISCHNFLFCHKFHKIADYFSFEVLKKKIWANFQRNIELLTQKIVTKLSKIWIWDPGSGKNLFWILDPGVKKAPDPGSGSATPEFWASNIPIRMFTKMCTKSKVLILSFTFQVCRFSLQRTSIWIMIPCIGADPDPMDPGFRIRIDLMRIRIRIRIQHFF